MVILLTISAICVILIFLYLITIHYIIAIEISEGIDDAKTDVVLIPFDPNKKYD